MGSAVVVLAWFGLLILSKDGWSGVHRNMAIANQETPERLIAERYDKFRRMGNFFHEVAL